MKIAIVTKRFHTNLYYTVKALREAGHAVELLVWHKGFAEKYDISEPFVIGYSGWSVALNKQIERIKNAAVRDFLRHKLPFLNLEELIDQRRLWNKLKEIKPDVVLARAYPNLTFLMMIIASRLNCRNVFLLAQTAEHCGETFSKKIYLFVLKYLLRIRGLITPLQNSLSCRDDFFIYLPFVIEAPDFAKKYFANGRVNIFSIGKFVRRKDHLLLLEAVNELRHKYDLSLTILGEKVEERVWREIADYVAANDLEKIVAIKFNLPYGEALASYKDFDLFVLPAYNEPAAYSPLEAMANKLPVIVSDTCGTKGYIKEGETGYIFKSHDWRDLAEKIERIISDRDKLKLMGEAAFRAAQNEHSLEIFSRGFAEIIKNEK
ncbi:MAG TPA: glycosyltransferase family 4 protein [Candidatus Nanoarchaeia archaeon]|nr:glycosyltransferase family 4 protein [Candidatus Nanoarchaeia archaeon]